MCDDDREYEYNYQIDSLMDQIYDLKEQLRNQVDITLDLQVQNERLVKLLKGIGVTIND